MKSIMWKKLKEDHNYMISENGQIMRRNNGLILKPFINNYGYYRVSLYTGSRKTRKNYLVHRLVASNWLGELDDNKYIDHINQDKSNNRVDNLRIVSHEENMHYYWYEQRFITD